MIFQDECRHRVRFSLSDTSGELVFTDFKVINGDECAAAQTLEKHLVGRALSRVDWSVIEDLGEHDTCTCASDVIAVLDDCQKQFSRGRERRHESSHRHG